MFRTTYYNIYESREESSKVGENTIDKEYLAKCNKYHNDWLKNIDDDILHLNGDIEFETQPNIINEWLNDIEKLAQSFKL